MNMRDDSLIFPEDKNLNGFNNKGTILWVCSSGIVAEETWTKMGRPQSIRMTHPGAALMATQVNRIILDDVYGTLRSTKFESEKKFNEAKEKIEQWLTLCVYPRNMPGGDVLTVGQVG